MTSCGYQLYYQSQPNQIIPMHEGFEETVSDLYLTKYSTQHGVELYKIDIRLSIHKQ